MHLAGRSGQKTLEAIQWLVFIHDGVVYLRYSRNAFWFARAMIPWLSRRQFNYEKQINLIEK